ncbi:DNA-binding transcriptional regulator, ArsR family [Nonomuraea jiangxiensis]|uniref:DNA-binding transcriptional regulator, ArsR family n=1 Tax=Nonomuraea jiangxiensis TaxID=633440 RepID=A0A1G9R1Z8_9ACTN|nr:DNA-binding transcriptional regulator, ArsR family [Nonomuraea jiangxiensis]
MYPCPADTPPRQPPGNQLKAGCERAVLERFGATVTWWGLWRTCCAWVTAWRAGNSDSPQPLVDRELGNCHNSYVLDVDLVKALASDKRLLILEWLRDPERHFPPQRDGDLVRDGVCSLFIAQKLGVSQPTCGEHLKVLAQAGLLRGRKIKQWVFYQRDEHRISEAKELLSGEW